MSDRVIGRGRMAGMPERAFRLFHLRAHGVQVVAGRNHRKQQDEGTTKNANENKRRNRWISCWSARNSASQPQQICRQQQRQPTEIKKKLHTKHPGPLENGNQYDLSGTAPIKE